MIEFAVASPLLLLYFLVLLGFGMGMYQYSLIDGLARMGTRYAIVRGSACSAADCPATAATIQSYILSQVYENESPLTITTTWPGTNSGCSSASSPYNGPGCLVKVTVSTTFSIAWWPMTISSTSQMIIDQ